MEAISAIVWQLLKAGKLSTTQVQKLFVSQLLGGHIHNLLPYAHDYQRSMAPTNSLSKEKHS
jgi:hypothetical protein